MEKRLEVLDDLHNKKKEKSFMNVYDFDGTIYDGDSGTDFIKFIFLKRPVLITWHLIKTFQYFILYGLKKISFKEMKEYLFSFVTSLSQIDSFIEEFVQKHKDRIKKFYSQIRKNDDVIISASLDFYLIPLCKEIGIQHVICTKYDTKKGNMIGENCKAEEKVKRFEEIYGKDAKIDIAYGDSKSDIPMLKRAKKAYMVNGEDLVEFVDKS